MQTYQSLAEKIQCGSNHLVGGYPVTNFMMSNEGTVQQGGAARLKDLVVPVGLVLDNFQIGPSQTRKYKECKGDIGVLPDDVFTNLMNTVTFLRNTNTHTKKRLQIKKTDKATRSRSQ